MSFLIIVHLFAMCDIVHMREKPYLCIRNWSNVADNRIIGQIDNQIIIKNKIMKKTGLFVLVMLAGALCGSLQAQQLPDPHFEDWSGAKFKNAVQPKYWHGSNVSQAGFEFNFTFQESGRSGYCVMVKDQEVGAIGITELAPGYFGLGNCWSYISGINTSSASGGMEGGISFTYRPDTISVWIKRTGSHTADEDFHVLFYSWSGQARGDKYRAKGGSCASTTHYDDESDVRVALDGNDCGSTTQGHQIAEGWLRERKQYNSWTNVRVPIYYMNNDVPEKCNVIFSSGNYPNFRASTGLYDGNALYVDDVELIYAASIQKLYVDGREWKGFDPNNTGVQVYALGESATAIPSIEAVRGAGALTNSKGTTVNFSGRTLTSSEMSIENGNLTDQPTRITVQSADGSRSQVYQIQFKRAASSNAKLAGITVNGEAVANFSATRTAYSVALPYGTTAAPTVGAEGQEDGQVVSITQPTSPTGTATITVTAPNGQATMTYTLTFSIAELADNTLAGIRVNGRDVPGFTPSQTIYKVSLPVGTAVVPTIEAVSAYPAGAQTITYTLPDAANLDGGSAQIRVTTPGNPTAKVYKLNFRLEASSYSYLSDLQVGGVSVPDFETTNLTYYVNLPMGTTSLPAINAVAGDEYQTISVVEGGLDGTTRVTVTAGNGDQTVYKIVFSTEKSEISILQDIRIGGESLADFSSDRTMYTYRLAIGTTSLPTIEPVASDEFQTITMTTGGVNGTTRITVTAGNGNTTIYLITFEVDSYTDNTLRMIYLDGAALADFSPEQTTYTIDLPRGTTELPVVTYDKQDEQLQTVNVRNGGLNGEYRLTVRPQSGASRTYILLFRVEVSTNTALQMIYVDGEALADFTPEQAEYTVDLPEGVSIIPTVTYLRSEASQRVLNVLEDTTQILTVTAESGDRREYRVNFRIHLSANAFLDMIYLDGTPLEGFTPEETNYTVQLTSEQCPAVTVDKAPGQQVSITTPVGAGKAVILVAPEQGATQRYTITFLAPATTSAQLLGVLLDGVAMDDFVPATLHYTRSYDKSLPVVTCQTDEGQTAEVLWNGEQVWLHVSSADGASSVYDITFVRRYAANTMLASILADGVQLPDFVPTERHYTYDLAAGSRYPALTYVRADSAQTVLSGQTAEGLWEWLVTADNGDTASYSVRYTIAQYDDATLADLALVGLPEGQTFTFDPETFEYSGLTLDEGAPLPQVVVTARPGQTVFSYDVSETEQQVLVTAENGNTHTYIITYVRKQSSNALLADILVDGVSLPGFAPEVHAYTDSLPWRSTTVPSIFPVGQLSNQTITTEFCRPGGTMRITVQSQDGSAETVYTIAFPVRRSSNTALDNLYAYDAASDTYYDFDFRAAQTDYDVLLPYQSPSCPQLFIEKQEEEQRIDIESRPLGDTTLVSVTAEDGSQRVYRVYFHAEQPTAANLLQSITIMETGQKLNMTNKTQRDFTVALPYGTRTMTVSYNKNYEEQTVFIQPGGVYAPTVITVKANRPDDEDVVYILTPQVVTQNPAVLNSILINGTQITGFDKNRFTYVIDIADVGIIPQVQTEQESGVRCMTEQDLWHWKGTVSSQGYTNEYQIFWHYPNEKIPNGEFTSWENNAKGSAQKPSGWNATNDYVSGYYSADYVTKLNDTRVQLYNRGHTTLGWVASYGCAPAMLNLASMTASHVVSGNSRTKVSGSVDFHNTPDMAVANYAYPNIDDDNVGAVFRFLFVESNGTEHTYDLRQKTTVSSFSDHTLALPIDGMKIKGFDVIIDAAGAVLNGGKGQKNAKLQVDYVRFLYNSTPKEATVNGIAATLSGKVFTATLTDPEDVNMPSYEFHGEVSDQAQLLTWAEPVIDGGYSVRTATIRNYAEDGTYTDGYSLRVRRPLDTRNQLSDLQVSGTTLTGFAPATTAYTCHLSASTRTLPDLVPVPASSLQTVATAYADSTMTITVTPESGEPTVYTVRFVTDLSDDTSLATLKAGDEVLDAGVRTHTVSAAHMPDITFTKQSDGQTVRVHDGLITVIAENGAVGTYTITRQDTLLVMGSAQIREFELNGEATNTFGMAQYDTERTRPELVTFSRLCDNDSVLFVQTPVHMQWQVFGNEQHTYTLTYPNTVSDNTLLADVLLDGVSYSQFVPTLEDYTSTPILSDTTLVLCPVAAEQGQVLQTAQTQDANGLTYAIQVTAPNGNIRTYRLRVAQPVSDDNALDAILLDGTPLATFHPDTLAYTLYIPSPAVKTVQPAMPSVAYVAGHPAQTIEMTAGTLGRTEPTLISVTAQNGSTRDYSVTVIAEPSHCADLTGIMVNGTPLDHFEAGRHYYSTEANSDDIQLVYMSDDRFQTVEVLADGTNRTVHVVAEDGVTTADYEVQIFVRSLSSDATLANILLDTEDRLVELQDYERALNPRLRFDPMQHEYYINLPAGSTIPPSVSAQLHMDGQQVDINKSGMVVTITVTALDGSTNTYTLHFEVPLSTNANLSMIFLNGDSLQGFAPEMLSYVVSLPEGVYDMPEVVGQKGEARQTIVTPEVDLNQRKVTIRVLAEDQSVTQTYSLIFPYQPYTADTLRMVYADGDSLRTFAPRTYLYNDTLPIGSVFPDLTWDKAYPTQSVTMDTVHVTPNEMARHIHVVAENGAHQTYKFLHVIRLSDADTLLMIYVNQHAVGGFLPRTMEYYDTLSIAEAERLGGGLPPVEVTQGDPEQTVTYTIEADTVSGKSLGYRTVITVTAPSGAARTYVVHHLVRRSSDTNLAAIYVAGKPLDTFDEENYTYRIEWEARDGMPAVSADTKEPTQVCDIVAANDTATLTVTAEDGTQATYRVIFVRRLSDNTRLDDIDIAGHSDFRFSPDEFDYSITLPYGEDTIPAISILRHDSLQTVPDTYPADTLPNGDVQLTITVIAPNGEDEAAYTLTFRFSRNSDAGISSLLVGDHALPDFTDGQTDYEYVHPYGTDSAAFFDVSDIQVLAHDSAADVRVERTDNGTLLITVTAQDGTTQVTYTITQSVALDGNNLLSAILLNGDTLRGFDPACTDYTYWLMQGIAPPAIEAFTQSDNAEATWRDVAAGDTCVIICTAQDGSERRYLIHFAVSQTNSGLDATGDDVLLKHMGGGQIFVATVRRGVTFALYDHTGALVRIVELDVADPNDAVLMPDANGVEQLLDVTSLASGKVLSLQTNNPYFYVFFCNDKRIRSGKIATIR